MVAVRTLSTTELSEPERRAVRAMLDVAFGGEFTDEDWSHCLGGRHVLAAIDGITVAHAAVVPRSMWLGGSELGAGYVEGVAVLPEVQGAGIGTMVMEDVGSLIQDRFVLGALSTGQHHFYERLGWERWTGRTFVRVAGELVRTPDDDDAIMVLRFGASQHVTLTGTIICDVRSGDVW